MNKGYVYMYMMYGNKCDMQHLACNKLISKTILK